MQDDVLFSAFLSSLVTFASMEDRPQLDEIELEGITVQVEHTEGKPLNSLLIEDMRLVFLYTMNKDFTIAAGFDADQYEKGNGTDIVEEFLQRVEEFMDRYEEVDWGFVSTDTLLSFESELLSSVIHPFFNEHDMKDNCPLGDNCPFRIALYEEQGSLIDRLRKKITEYREMSMLRKIWRMMTGSPYKVET